MKLRLALVSMLAFSLAVLAEEKKLEIPASPPKDFDAKREKIERGKLDTTEYDSKSVGAKRKAVVYMPPGYSKETKYPTLYLLHGIGDTETGWTDRAKVENLFDNLLADKKIAPMVVVMPNGRADKVSTPKTPWNEQGPAFEAFEADLLKDLIPHIEKNYSVKADRVNRALIGFSMGGGQSINFGLKNSDTFAYVGGFAPAPNTKKVKDLVPDAAKLNKELKLLWLSVGDTDFILKTSEKLHAELEEMKIPHYWHINQGGHTWEVCKDDLFRFAPLIFQKGK